ncbi:unnamed protein product [Amoebophrya sp. A25]|nr:unnamed protein product [Amoebophrya sp. A25]|eukprot:GSA25T00004588001.1
MISMFAVLLLTGIANAKIDTIGARLMSGIRISYRI